jgi:ABC-type sugar transport system substrate-binding protein
MHDLRRDRRLLAAALLALASTACGGTPTGSGASASVEPSAPPASTSVAPPAGSPSASTVTAFTPDEVKAASKPWDCDSVYDVPKGTQDVKLAFINPGPADPYVAAWSVAMKDAARFYGVDFKEGFLGNYDYSKLIDTYRTVSAFSPDVVGTLSDDATGKALQAAVAADSRQLLMLDTILKGVPWIGLQNVEAGTIMGESLKASVEPLLAGDWASRKIVVVGVTAEGCVPCDERVDGAFHVLKGILPESKTVKYIRLVEKNASVDAIQTRMTDVITANPGAAFVVATLDDESGGGAFNAIRRAGLENLARLATIGGDNLAISNLLLGSPTYVASVDGKPYCEGWNWVEAAIATHNGKEFRPYPLTSVITPANVSDFRWRLDIKF